MPCWYYDKKDLRDTPSIQDGISFETERRYRKDGVRFIMSCGTQLGLGHNTKATGVVYFHRFYMFHSFKSFPRYVTACCCLFLAGKVEETPKKCRDIIKIARTLLSDNYFFSFGDDPKEEVMTLERILLQTIKFDLQVEHPYTFLLKYAKCFDDEQLKLQEMVQMAWNFVNDSLSTVVCLQWEPEIIAVALIHLASKLSKFTVVDWVGRLPNHTRWWDMFVSDVTMEILEDICHQILDLYQSNQIETIVCNSPLLNPPSRFDSPTPTKLIMTSTSTRPIAAKLRSPQSTITVTTITPTISTLIENSKNIQAIKPVLNVGPSVPGACESMAISTVDITPSYHNMYALPAENNSRQIPVLCTSSTPASPQPPSNRILSIVPPPPPPPMGPYSIGVAVNWGPPVSWNPTSHYSTNASPSMTTRPNGDPSQHDNLESPQYLSHRN